MSLWPGRTYRYYVGKPLFEFGTGLSYTTFSVTCAKKKASPNVDGTFLLVDVRWGVNVTCAVKNVGTREGDEVVMAFHSAGAGIRTAVAGRHPVPIKSLVGFQRTSLVRHTHSCSYRRRRCGGCGDGGGCCCSSCYGCWYGCQDATCCS